MDIITLLVIGIISTLVIFLFTLSGGIGLILRPMIMFFGVPPDVTIASSRLSAIPGNIISIFMLNKSKKINWRLALTLAPIYVVGGFLGIFIIINFEETILKQIIGFLLIIAGILISLKKQIGIKKSESRLGKRHYLMSYPILFVAGVFLVLIGGIGPLTRLLFVFGYGQTYIEAAATQKVINFAHTIITAFFFIYFSLVDIWLLITLVIATIIGTYTGTRYGLKKGERYIRILLLVIIFASAVKLIIFT